MRFLKPVPDPVRPTYIRLLAYGLLRSPGQALMVGLASLIAVKSLAAPPWEVAILAASLPFGNLLAIFWSKWIARSSNKIAYAFWPEIASSIVLFLPAFANNSHTFTGGLCVFLLLRAPIVQAHSAILRANYPAKWRSWLLARVLAMSEMLMAGAGLAFGLLLELDPMLFRALFPVAGTCGLVGAFQVGAIRLHGETTANQTNALSPEYSLPRILGVLRHDHRFLRYEIAFFLFGFANIMTLPIIPLFLEHDLGIRYLDAGLILVTLPMVLDILMLPFWGRTLDRQNPLLMRAIFNVIFAFGILTYSVAISLQVFATGRMIVAFVQGGSVLVWVLGVNYFARREEVPVYMGLHQSLTGIRGVIAPFVGITLAALLGGYRPVFFVAFVLMNVGTLVMIGEVRSELRRTGGRLPSYAQAERDIDTRFSA